MKRLRKNKATYCCSVVDNPFFEYQHLFYIPTILLCLAINTHKQVVFNSSWIMIILLIYLIFS